LKRTDVSDVDYMVDTDQLHYIYGQTHHAKSVYVPSRAHVKHNVSCTLRD